MFNWIKTHKLIFALVLVTLGMGVYFYSHKSTPEYTEYRVESGSIRDTLELSGKVTADGVANLRFPAGGLVTYLGAKEGDTVKKWQTLATIDSRQLQKTLEQKLNLYKSQLNTFDDTKDTYQDNLESGDIDDALRRILDRNQFSLENSVKDVEYLDISIKLTRLTSPLAGVLVKAPTQTTGVNVTAGDAWIVVDPSTLYFSADLDETDLKRVKVGQKVEISLDAYPDKKFESSISSIAYAPKETTSGTVYEIKLALPTSDLADLRLGLNGSATIILTEKTDVPRLPSSALTFEGTKSSVYVKNGDKYEEKEIEVGIENDGYVEIIKGLSPNDQVYSQKSQ
ncbi:hypothetical protein DCC61_03330 [Candidatus Microgenomates bacterium]|nr:efflux RND transporter periplasmic adaptor subunit [Candidatus Microgenomates bacterium CPR3]RIK51228.1 MAG: hypothetical protein DCC61_03330 [Candidatus Microgenomates bacterium]